MTAVNGDRQLAGIPVDRLMASLLIAAAAGSLLFGYELIRSVSQSLFIDAYGARRLPLVMALVPVSTLLMIYGYARLLSVAGARTTIILTTLGSAIVLVVCHALFAAGRREASIVLYLFREAYIVLLIEQIWSFINSILRTGDGRKLNGPICGIASLGAISGGLLVHSFAMRVGSENLLLLAAASLVPTGLLAALAYGAGGEPKPSPFEMGGKHGHLGVRALLQNRTLCYLALLIIATQVVSTVVDLQLSRFVEAAIPIKDERTRWFGGFYAALNTVSAVGQFILTPVILRFFTLRRVHLGIPIAHLVACGISLLHPVLLTVSIAYFVFKALDYSLFRAAKELLYIPLSYDERYRAKELIDVFGYRLGKGGTSAILAVAGRSSALPLATYPVIAIVALLFWTPLSLLVTRSNANDPKTPPPL